MAANEPQAEFSVSLGDLIEIARRRFWWFCVPAGLGAGMALVVALVWPAEYEAAALVVVEAQAVPEVLVQSTVVADTESRFGHIKLMLLARDNLSQIIHEFELYDDETRAMEERVELMREKITIEPLPPVIVDPRKPVTIESFRIAFRGPNPATVAEVANRLTRDFLSANLRERASQAESTSEFIQAELAKTEEERARIAQELMEYREQHQGELPEDLAMNNQRLDRLKLAQQAASSQLETARTQVAEIRAQTNELRLVGTDDTSDPVSRKKTLELGINRFKAEGKTERHPDVRIARAELAQLEQLLSKAYESDAPLSPVERALSNEVRGHEVRMSVLRREIAQIEEDMADIEARLVATPQRTAQITQLSAAFNGLSEAIRVLSAKKMAADMGRSVELVQKGEKFRVIESAVPPTSPVFPNRPLFFVVGAVLGIGFGLLLLVVREITDQSFHSLGDLQRSLALPVLGAIPVIELPTDLARTRSRLRRLVITGGVLLGLLAGGGFVYYLISSTPSSPAPEANTTPAAGSRGAHV